MNKVGIVTCQVLELEVAFILSCDPEVEEIWVVENKCSENLIASLKKKTDQRLYLIKDPEEFKTSIDRKTRVLVDVKKVGLHSHIPTLQKEVKTAVKRMAPFVDAVFLGYGLCGNAFRDMDKMFYDTPVPVFISMDKDGPVDDCVGLIIGGRENYYAEQCKCAGTMFINSGFSKYCEGMISGDIPKRLQGKKDNIMKQIMKAYKRCLLLPTPVMSESELAENVKAFSLKYGLAADSRPGTLELLQRGWDHTKSQSLKNPHCYI